MLNYDIESCRRLFTITSTGTVYLNHAATSPLSTKVIGAIDEYLSERSGTPVDNFARMLRMSDETRSFTAKLLNASPDRIAFFDNTSNAMNLLAAGLKWKRGDRILLNDMEFPANVYPFLNLRKFGVEVDFVMNRGGGILPEDIEHMITPQTRLLSISHVQFLSGFRADLERIGELCREKGVLFSVDAIQSAGVIPIDVERMRIDFLATGGQKWLMAPQGIAAAFIPEKTQEQIDQAYLGWTSMRNYFSNLTKYEVDLAPTARRYENGTLNHIGIVGLHESLSTLLEVGIEKVQEHVLDLTGKLIEEVSDLGLEVFVGGPRDQRAGIVSIRVEQPEKVLADLAGDGIEVTVRQGWIRVSPHFYNTEEEIMRVVGSLRKSLGFQ